MERKRICNLDLLKVLGCLAVIGLHVFTYNYENALITYIHYMSGYAVPVFFMVNGYLIMNKAEVSYPYVFRKIFHIVLIVVLWNALFFLADFILKHSFENPVILVAKSFVQKGFLWQFWFLGAMILTYLTAPPLHKLVHHVRMGYELLLGILLVINIGFVVLNFVLGYSFFNGFIQTFRIWKWLFYFLFGGYAKNMMTSIKSKIPFRWHLVAAICLFLGFPLYQLFADHAINYGDYYTDPIAILNNTCLFTLLMRIPCNEKVTKSVTFLSALGMGCYIIHPIILTFVDRRIDYTYTFLPFLIFPVVTAVSFLLTYLLKKFKITSHFVDL